VRCRLTLAFQSSCDAAQNCITLWLHPDRWYEQHAQAVWNDSEERPSLQETRDHAKGLSRALLAARELGSTRSHRYLLRSHRGSLSDAAVSADCFRIRFILQCGTQFCLPALIITIT